MSNQKFPLELELVRPHTEPLSAWEKFDRNEERKRMRDALALRIVEDSEAQQKEDIARILFQERVKHLCVREITEDADINGWHTDCWVEKDSERIKCFCAKGSNKKDALAKLSQQVADYLIT